MDQTIFNGYIDERFQGTINAELAVAMIGSDGTSTLVGLQSQRTVTFAIQNNFLSLRLPLVTNS